LHQSQPTSAQPPSPQSPEIQPVDGRILPTVETPEQEQHRDAIPTAISVWTEHEDGFLPAVTTVDSQIHEPAIPLSPIAPSQISLLEISPFEWYDLIARDAISNAQKLNDLFNADPTWTFDESSLSRRQSIVPDSGCFDADSNGRSLLPNGESLNVATISQNDNSSTLKPWHTAHNIALSSEDLGLMRHYVDVVGPILDLFDPSKHFTNVVPHLSMRNTGLLKSVLAVAAHHMSLSTRGESAGVSSNSHTAFGNWAAERLQPHHLATQYYYETLQYLSQTLLHPGYAESPEILATAMMISTYEMFEADVDDSSKPGDWERHLRGAFWIQRNQDNNAESVDGMRRAGWWAWVRQDIWAAFRAGRPTLTIFHPQRTINEMNSDELASWSVFLAAKCVEYSTQGRSPIDHQDLRQRIDRGNHLLQCLQEWHDILPASFAPMTSSAPLPAISLQGLAGFTPDSSTPYPAVQNAGESSIFPPVWIHPPNHAAGMQMYHFARSLVLLSQPSTGDLVEFRRRQKQLNDSLHMICGISNACHDDDAAMALVNCQALYASKHDP
jgi:hypothetical protein